MILMGKDYNDIMWILQGYHGGWDITNNLGINKQGLQ